MPTSRPTNVRWLIVALLVGFAFLGHFNRVSISVAGNAHFIGPDKLSAEQMGIVYSTFGYVYTALMLPGGWLIDRIGPRWAMTLFGLGLGCCAALTGVLGWLGLAIAAMFVPLLLIRGIAGASSVALHPGAARTVSLWLPLRERSTANGLVTAGALVGIAVCYPGFGWLMDRLDWPSAFVVSGATLAVFGLVWCLLAADDPASHRWANPASQHLLDDTDYVPARTRATLRDFIRLFRNRSLILLTLSYGAVGYVQYMFFYWVEYYFGKVLHLPDSESRNASFVIMMAMAVGMAAGGWVSDQMSRRFGQRRGWRSMAMASMGLCALFSLLGIVAKEPQLIVLCFSLSLGTLGLCEGIFWTAAPILERRNGGLASAMLNTGGNGIGFLAPILTPVIGNAFGWSTAVVVACSVCALGGVLWLGIRPTEATDRPD